MMKMIISFTVEEKAYIGSGFEIKSGCPESVRKSIENKLKLFDREESAWNEEAHKAGCGKTAENGTLTSNNQKNGSGHE